MIAVFLLVLRRVALWLDPSLEDDDDDYTITVDFTPEDLDPRAAGDFTWTMNVWGMRTVIEIAREADTTEDALLAIYANTDFTPLEDDDEDD